MSGPRPLLLRCWVGTGRRVGVTGGERRLSPSHSGGPLQMRGNGQRFIRAKNVQFSDQAFDDLNTEPLLKLSEFQNKFSPPKHFSNNEAQLKLMGIFEELHGKRPTAAELSDFSLKTIGYDCVESRAFKPKDVLSISESEICDLFRTVNGHLPTDAEREMFCKEVGIACHKPLGGNISQVNQPDVEKCDSVKRDSSLSSKPHPRMHEAVTKHSDLDSTAMFSPSSSSPRCRPQLLAPSSNPPLRSNALCDGNSTTAVDTELGSLKSQYSGILLPIERSRSPSKAMGLPLVTMSRKIRPDVATSSKVSILQLATEVRGSWATKEICQDNLKAQTRDQAQQSQSAAERAGSESTEATLHRDVPCSSPTLRLSPVPWLRNPPLHAPPALRISSSFRPSASESIRPSPRASSPTKSSASCADRDRRLASHQQPPAALAAAQQLATPSVTDVTDGCPRASPARQSCAVPGASGAAAAGRAAGPEESPSRPIPRRGPLTAGPEESRHGGSKQPDKDGAAREPPGARCKEAETAERTGGESKEAEAARHSPLQPGEFAHSLHAAGPAHPRPPSPNRPPASESLSSSSELSRSMPQARPIISVSLILVTSSRLDAEVQQNLSTQGSGHDHVPSENSVAGNPELLLSPIPCRNTSPRPHRHDSSEPPRPHISGIDPTSASQQPEQASSSVALPQPDTGLSESPTWLGQQTANESGSDTGPCLRPGPKGPKPQEEADSDPALSASPRNGLTAWTDSGSPPQDLQVLSLLSDKLSTSPRPASRLGLEQHPEKHVDLETSNLHVSSDKQTSRAPSDADVLKPQLCACNVEHGGPPCAPLHILASTRTAPAFGSAYDSLMHRNCALSPPAIQPKAAASEPGALAGSGAWAEATAWADASLDTAGSGYALLDQCADALSSPRRRALLRAGRVSHLEVNCPAPGAAVEAAAADVVAAVAACLTAHTTLTVLRLSRAGLGETPLPTVAPIAAALAARPGLVRLDLSHNALADGAAGAVTILPSSPGVRSRVVHNRNV